MIEQIWKWPLRLDVAGKAEALRVPAGTKFLSAHLQGSSICVWGLVDAKEKNRSVRFIQVVGTGQPLLDVDHRFLGTIVFGPELVLHVFELLDKPDPAEVLL